MSSSVTELKINSGAFDQAVAKAEITKESKVKDHDVIYTLRSIHQKQTNMTVLADQKANILIGIVAFILTVLTTNLSFLDGLKIELLIPFIGFMLLELITLFLAMMVIMPKLKGSLHFTNIEKCPNPLFFQFFSEFKEDDLINYLMEEMNDDSSARAFLIKDIYQVGLVLKQKYDLLRKSYMFAVLGVVFLIGMIFTYVFTH